MNSLTTPPSPTVIGDASSPSLAIAPPGVPEPASHLLAELAVQLNRAATASDDLERQRLVFSDICPLLARLPQTEQILQIRDLKRRVPQINLNDVRAAIRSQPSQHHGAPNDSLNDVGNAKRLLEMHGKQLLYCPAETSLYIWDKNRWSFDVGDRVATQLATSAMEHTLTVAREEMDKTLASWASDSLNARRLASMIDLAKKSSEIRTASADELDADPWLLNCPNGTVNLKAGAMSASDPSQLLTKLCPTSFNPGSQCPRFEAFLSEVMDNDEEMIAFLQRYAGMLATGSTKDQLFFIHYGEGSNGKSVFFNILMKVLGREYATIAPRNLLVMKRAEGHSTDVTELRGRRLVVAVESQRGATLDMAMVKWWTGSEAITARRICQDNASWIPTHKLVLQTNHKPVVTDNSDGAWRRLRLVPWKVTIPPEKRIGDLDRTLVDEEAVGILAWIIRGAKEYAEHGLGVPQKVTATTDEYRTQQDQLTDFIEERCELAPENLASNVSVESYATPVSALFPEYQRWCDSQRMTSINRLTREDFKKLLEQNYRIKDRAVRVEGKSTKCWVGIRLTNPHSNGVVPFTFKKPESPEMVDRLNQARQNLVSPN